MLATVVLVGLVGKKAGDNARYLEIERNYKDHTGKFQKDLIPVVYWNKVNNNFFMNLSEGSYVAIHGRLETIASIGVGVIGDTLHYMGTHELHTIEAPPKVV